MTTGLTADGFSPETLATIAAEIDADLRSTFGAGINTSPETIFGQLKGIMGERYARLWDLAGAVHQAFDPDQAVGAAQDRLAALTGTTRLPATKSTVSMLCTGTPGTVLASGRAATVAGNSSARFETLASATIAALTAWAGATAYTVGQQRTNGGQVYLCTGAGTSAGSGGPSGTGTAIVDGGVTWRWLGAGTGAVAVEAEATETGPIAAPAYTLTTIATPTSGWSGVTNLLDAEEGRNLESDADLRSRREAELRAQGSAALEAIRADVLEVEGVTSCAVFENTTMLTDADGLPAKSIEVLVEGGTPADIRAAIFASKAAGIATHGSEVGTVTDSKGVSHTVKFSRPTAVPIWVTVNLLKDSALWPSDGAAQVKAAIVDFGDELQVNADVVASRLAAEVFNVSGVVDVTSVLIGTASPPASSATIAITNRQRATFDTSRVVVNAT